MIYLSGMTITSVIGYVWFVRAPVKKGMDAKDDHFLFWFIFLCVPWQWHLSWLYSFAKWIADSGQAVIAFSFFIGMLFLFIRLVIFLFADLNWQAFWFRILAPYR